MVQDMTEGSVSRILLKFSIPMLISAVFQQLYNMADSVIAGHFAGRRALAAVGASYPVTMIFMAVAAGLSIGCTVVISRYFGAGDHENMKSAVFTSILSALAIGAVFTAAGLPCSRPVIELLKTDPVIISDSALYLNIYILGLLFLFLYNICNGIFIALGDSRTPLIFLIISSVANIFVDLLFVAVFKMGVAGVAWATFLCQSICSVSALFFLLRRLAGIRTERPYRKFSLLMLKNIGVMAVPSILQQSFISVGNLCVQGLVNSYGVDATAGYSAAVKLNTFAVTGFTTMGNSISAFTAQNMGAGRPERIRSGYRIGLLIIIAAVIPFTILYFFFAPEMVRLFMDPRDAENFKAIAVGVDFLKIVSPFFAVISLKLVADGVLRGAGAMRYFMIATFSDLVIRVVLSFVLHIPYGTRGIWMSWPVGWVLGSALSCWFYFREKWKMY